MVSRGVAAPHPPPRGPKSLGVGLTGEYVLSLHRNVTNPHHSRVAGQVPPRGRMKKASLPHIRAAKSPQHRVGVPALGLLET